MADDDRADASVRRLRVLRLPMRGLPSTQTQQEDETRQAMNLKLHIVKTKRSDVICCGCGKFGADHVAMLADGSETDYGVHRGKKFDCVARLHVKRGRKVVSHAAE